MSEESAFIEADKKLNSFINLNTVGWDSHSAKPIAPCNIDKAREVVRQLLFAQCQPPQIVPTVAGGVQLEWHNYGYDVEIEIESGSIAQLSVSTSRPMAFKTADAITWMPKVFFGF